MAQTTLNIYVADQIYKYETSLWSRNNICSDLFRCSYVARILGTVLGLVIGTAVWYIGS